MTKRVRRIAALAIAVPVLAVTFTACNDNSSVDKSSQYQQVQKKAAKSKAYLPKNSVELDNYNEAQKLYDNPDTIIWCSTTWGNASAPIVTVPIKGKLTSSTVSYFPNQVVKTNHDGDIAYNPELRSVDGMFHGTPPPYRYGFTPGGQYVDFFNMPTVCTTALTSFQRQNTKVQVTIDPEARAAQKAAEAALKANDPAAAQAALAGLGSN